MRSGSAICCYDANGNMTQKIDGSSTTSYTYDAENRMTAVSGAATATFVYDEDGNRVKGTVDGVTTTYIGNHFEWTGSTSTMKKYYYAGGTRVAERVGTLSTSYYFLLTDHLGSTSITATRLGVFSSELRYKAWDRYSYVYNNPMSLIDPSGHKACSNDGNSFDTCMDPLSATLNELGQVFGITFSGDWSDRNKIVVIAAAGAVGMKFSTELGGSASEAFTSVYKNGITITWGTSGAQSYCYVDGIFGGGGCTNSGTSINFVSLVEETVSGGGYITVENAFIKARNNVVHELGHAFASLWYHGGVYSQDGPYGSGQISPNLLNELGFVKLPEPDHLTWRQHPGDTGQNEIFADMFLGWTFGVWDTSVPMGMARDAFMMTNMAEWISTITK